MTDPISIAKRDLGWIDQWVLVRNPTRFFDDDAKRFGISVEYFVGFLYVDAEAGMSIDLLSFCSVDGSHITMTRGGRQDRMMLKVRYDVFAYQMEVSILTDEQRRSLKLPEKPNWLATYYPKHQKVLEQLRKIELLDSIRSPGFPDDILFILPSPRPGMVLEKVWGRLLGQVQSDVFVVQLLNQPNQDYGGIRQGDILAVQVMQLKDGVGAVCVGKMTTS